MGAVGRVLSEFWGWLPKWQLYAVLGAMVVLFLLSKRRFAVVAFLVALFVWVMGFVISYKQIFKQLQPVSLLLFVVISVVFALAIVWVAIFRRT